MLLKVLTIIGTIIVFMLLTCWIVRRFKGFLRVVLILVLILLVLGLITNPEGLMALGWFLFSAVCSVLAISIISFLKG